MDITAIARTCHEANRAYCAALGDLSQKPWADADQWQRDSAIKGVQFILDNPDAGPSASHDSWLEEKRATGWSYGPVKDPEAKTHPCFVAYDELPPEQRAKDYIFGAIVRAGIETPRTASDELPIARQVPLTPEEVDALSFAARTAHVAAGELYGLMMTDNAVRLEDWYGSRLGELDTEIDRLAAFICTHKIDQAETVWRYGIDLGIIVREARAFGDLSFARRQAFAVFAQVCVGTATAIEKVQQATEAERQARKSKQAETPLKREDSILEERDGLDELVPYGKQVLDRQKRDDAERAKAAKAAELFGGKGDHDGDGKPGGSKPAIDTNPSGSQAPMSIGEPVTAAKQPNKGGRPKKPKV